MPVSTGPISRVASVLARLLTLVAVATSLTAFVLEVTVSNPHWWVGHLDRAGYVLVVLAVVAALLAERQASAIWLGVLALTAAASVVFAVIAFVKYYDTTSFLAFNAASPWLNEAQTLAVAAFAFGLTLARQRSTAVVACLLAATGATVGCAIYAITREADIAAEVWWFAATVTAFLAAAAAAQVEREGSGAPAANRIVT
jgi:hypothetical protein